MATYSVTLYKSSGYNVINIPDTPHRLAADATTMTLPSVNILQNRRLNSITVACENADAEDADYIKIGNMFYAIVDFTMVSVSTCTFQIVEKPLLSVGGVSVSSDGTVTTNFDILDGITSRCTVADDSWGAYTSEDPLTAPQEPLQIQSEWLNPSGGSTASGISDAPIFRESTVDLSHQLVGLSGNTYTDDETGESVTVPATVPLPYVTGVGMQHTDFIVDGTSKSNGTGVYVVNDTTVADGQSMSAGQTIEQGTCAIRSLGQENGSIINQWTVPVPFLGGISITSRTGITGENNINYGTDQVVTSITGASGSLSSTISPDYTSVKNKRVLYGDYNKYGMITCAGNSAEFKPEDLGGETAPSISYKADPRPDGKPYYRFSTINGDSDFWRNSLSGSNWENVPLVYQGASGSALTRLNFDNERRIKSLAKDQYEQNYILSQAQAAAGIADSAINMAAGGSMMMSTAGSGSYAGQVSPGLEGVYNQGQSQMYTGGGGVLSGIAGMVGNAIKKGQYEDMYNAQKANELSGLYQATEVYAPTVNFPYNSDILRDVKNNGIMIYKYRLSDNDAARVDKLLTMYGYKTAEQLTPAHFGRRQKFDYVACSSVSVTGSYPKWLCDDIADELKNGIRIWHVKPDSSAYENNPVRS